MAELEGAVDALGAAIAGLRRELAAAPRGRKAALREKARTGMLKPLRTDGLRPAEGARKPAGWVPDCLLEAPEGAGEDA